jgi:hypothetical protein
MSERTLWQLLREYDIDLITAQHICNDAMINGVTVPGAAARVEALERTLREATLILEQAQCCITRETPNTLSKIRAFLNRSKIDKNAGK